MKVTIGTVSIVLTLEQAQALHKLCGSIGGTGTYSIPLTLGSKIMYDHTIRTVLTDPLYALLGKALNLMEEDDTE